MAKQSVFSALAKHSLAKDENYLTEAFTFLINSLLHGEKLVGIEILNKLCVENGGFCFDSGEEITVSTQEMTEYGTPDIEVSSSDKHIYIEVKDYSPVDLHQLKRYRKALDSSNFAIKRLVLLTRLPVDFSEHKGIPDKHVRWFEVYNWLTDIKVQDPISGYLIDSFRTFLEEKRMSIQRVSWEYTNGVLSFNNLMNMIEAAIKNVGLSFHKTYPRAAAWASKGFWLENRKYWCGIYYDTPLVVLLKAFNKKELKVANVNMPTYPIKEALSSIWFQLLLEDIHFFSLDRDRQLEEITKFIRTAYVEAKEMRPKQE